ncbi:MAG: hypothetical protein NC548_48375 [Lachnospiraceae bacterium]|nr:hypothetical protein [Lachnospiraceae bacterium]
MEILMFSKLKKRWEEWKLGPVCSRCRVGYRVEGKGKYKDIIKKNPDLKSIRIDIDDAESIEYMFHVYLTEPDARIFVEFADGTEREVKLGRRKKIRQSNNI